MDPAAQPYITYFSYFILGLGLNLTPCVYPMLTITLSLFRGSTTHTSWRAFGRALLYVAGIATMFTMLGILAAFTGEFFGGLLQNFWVLLAIGTFIIALSLSMFGLYSFRFPSWLVPQHRVAHVHLFSYFFSGLLVGIVAAPCMGPVILTLLVHVSQERDVVFGAVSFLLVALGMGLPYLVLGTFTGLLKKLPKSGAWLVWVERLLAVALFTFGCFYLIVAFRWPLLSWLIPVACLGGGLYLGWLERSAHESKKFVAFKRIAGTLIMALGLALLIGTLSLHSPVSMVWEDYRPGILENAKKEGQPVILDFYADWCLPCHELDQYTYSDPDVIEALRNFRRIKIDTTYLDEAQIEELVRRFDVYGVPTILFLNEQGQEVEEMRFSGFVPPLQFLNSIRGGPLKRYLDEEGGSGKS